LASRGENLSLDEGNLMQEIDDRLGRIEVALTEVRTDIKYMNGTVADLVAEIGSVPPSNARGGRSTLRDRLHVIENDNAAAKAAEAALAQAWGKGAKVALFVFAIVGAAGTVVSLVAFIN